MLIKFFSALNVNKIVMPRNYSSDRHYKCIDPFKDTKHKHTKPVRGKTVSNAKRHFYFIFSHYQGASRVHRFVKYVIIVFLICRASS